MYAQVDKPKGNKSKGVANSGAWKKSDGRQRSGFVENRPFSIQMRKLQEIATNKFYVGSQEANSNSYVFQLAEMDVKFRVKNPVRISTSSGNIYLLEGNAKYGETHAEKHSKEIKNVAARRGWEGSITNILEKAISQSIYTSYQVKDEKGSTVRIPVTARKMIVIAIADDGKIITAMIQNSDTEAIKLFWQNGPSEIQSVGWAIAKGKDQRKMEDAPWDLYTK